MRTHQLAILEQLSLAGACPTKVLWQLLQGIPLATDGRPVPWPALGRLSVAKLLASVIQLPKEWGIPAASARVLACGLLTDYLNCATPALDHEALITANDAFWQPLLGKSVLDVLSPTASALDQEQVNSAAIPETTLFHHTWTESTLNCTLSDLDGSSVGMARLVLGAPIAGSIPTVHLEYFEIARAVRQHGLGSHFLRKIVEVLSNACPAGAHLHVRLCPYSHPYPLTASTAPEWWCATQDAREVLSRFTESVKLWMSQSHPGIEVIATV
jgi:hypothetical protein